MLVKENDPALRSIASEVKETDDLRFVDIMRDVCRKYGGVGLAANQIGVLKRVILIKNEIMINPVIIWNSPDIYEDVEGCLSYPNVLAPVKRYCAVSINYMTLDWKTVLDKYYMKLDARIIQHEVDHLNGICKVGEFKRKQLLIKAVSIPSLR